MIEYYNKYGEKMRHKDFIELQWDRAYNECGSFVLYMAAKDYSPDIKYIKNTGRPETGIVQKMQYEKKPEGDFVTLSGFFVEKLLDMSMMFQDISNGNAYTSVKDPIRVLLMLGFEQYNDALKNQVGAAQFDGWTHVGAYIGAECLLQTTVNDNGVYPSNPPPLSVKQGVPIGQHIYGMTETDGYSYYCNPVFNRVSKEHTEPLIGVDIVGVKGRDLSDRVYFGHAFKNVKKVDYTADDSGVRSSYIAIQPLPDDTKYSHVISIYKDNKWEKAIFEKVNSNTNLPVNLGYCRPLKALYTTTANTDGAQSEATVRADMRQQATLDMLNNYKVENISVDVLQNRFYYLKDYDLGDICSIVIDEIQQQYTARIVEVHEVHSKNTVDVQIVLGTPQKQKYRRMI